MGFGKLIFLIVIGLIALSVYNIKKDNPLSHERANRAMAEKDGAYGAATR